MAENAKEAESSGDELLCHQSLFQWLGLESAVTPAVSQLCFVLN